MRHNHKRIAIRVSLLSLFLVLVSNSHSCHIVQGSGSGNWPPPTSGTWWITTDTLIQNEAIYLNGSLIIDQGANLTLQDSYLYMNSRHDVAWYYLQLLNGSLTLLNTTITGPAATNSRYYVQAYPGTSVHITDCNVSYAGKNIHLYGEESGIWINTPNAKVINNTFSHCEIGVACYQADHALITNNTAYDCSLGIQVRSSKECTISNNYVEQTIEKSYNFIGLDDSRIENNTAVDAFDHGFMCYFFDNCTIQGNRAYDMYFNGIYIYGWNSEVRENFVNRCQGNGIFVPLSHNILLFNNTIGTVDDDGILIHDSYDLTLILNTVINASDYAIQLEGSSTCTMILNQFSGYDPLAYDDGANAWDNGVLGNWWANYSTVDLNLDGIVDFPYVIDANSIDHFPLTTLPNPPYWLSPPLSITSEYGSPFSVNCTLLPDEPYLQWTVNASMYFAISESGLITNNTWLPVNQYTILITVKLPNNKTSTRVILVTVQDTTPPTWTNADTEITWNTATLFRYDFNASDLSGIHTWWISNTTSFQIDQEGILTNTEPLSPVNYSLIVFVNDTYGNTQSQEITITVHREPLPPVIFLIPIGIGSIASIMVVYYIYHRRPTFNNPKSSIG